jgi:hypothetical protein
LFPSATVAIALAGAQSLAGAADEPDFDPESDLEDSDLEPESDFPPESPDFALPPESEAPDSFFEPPLLL